MFVCGLQISVVGRLVRLVLIYFFHIARYTSAAGTPEQSARASLQYALQARRTVDIDNPSIEGLQALLILSQTFFAHGMGKKAYMTFCVCRLSGFYRMTVVADSSHQPTARRW